MASSMTVLVPDRGRSRCVVTGNLGPIASKVHAISGVKVTGGYVSTPAEPRLYELLESLGAKPNAQAQAWYERVTQAELVRMQFLRQEDFPATHSMASKLLPFQRVGAEYIARSKSLLLCDETGLGKTLQSIVGVETSLRHKKILVVCLNTLKHWWQAEYERWSEEHLPTMVLESSTRERQLREYRTGWMMTNYRQLLLVPQLARIQWDWVIFDEGHTLCNRKTKTFAAAKQLQAKRQLIVTASPYGNSPAELWALLNLIYPDRYRSYWRFYEMYVLYTENKYFGGRQVLGVKNEGLLRRDLAPVMIRRRKAEVYPQLPEKTYQTIPLVMERKQAKIYRTAARELYIQLEDDEVLTIESTMAKITRLRQILSTPAAFGLEDTSVKLDYISELMSSYEGKVVIFTLYRATVEAVLSRLDSLDIPSTVVWGGLKSQEVEDARQRFVKGDARVLVGTIAGAGTGLNLRKADAQLAIFVDRHWNPARQMQCEDRIHGIGQTGNVLIQSLHCKGTVDNLVEKILTRKLAMTEAILGQALREELERWT